MPVMNDCVSLLCEIAKPVLVLDTCTLLDIVRLPLLFPKKERAGAALASIRKILALANNNEPSMNIVIPAPVGEEWKRNVSSVTHNVAEHLSRIDKQIGVIHAIASSFTPISPCLTYAERKIEAALRNLGEGLLNVGMALELDENLKKAATNRAMDLLPPATKGAINDCMIYIHSFELFTRLRNGNFSARCVFMTSNTKDYCESARGPLKEPIRSELEAKSVTFVKTWPRVLPALGLFQPYNEK
jgi:hypothetical protein